MNKFEPDMEIKDLLFFFPIKLNIFMEFISSFVDGGVPKGIGVLMALKKYGPMSISHIGEAIAVLKSNMTSIIDDLVERGLVIRHISHEDRRIINVELTEGGSRLLEATIEKIDCVIKEKCSVLSLEEITLCVQSINNLTETFVKVMDNQKLC